MTRSRAERVVESALRQRLIGTWHRSFQVSPNRLLIGFSGGNDSLALVLLMKRIERLLDVPIHLIHVDHRLRPDSGNDARLAAEMAASIGLPIEILTASTYPMDRFPGVGPEDAARRVRFELLASEVDDGDVVVLAHHAQDQAETVLLHLLRGSGLDGLAGMRPTTELTVPWWNATAEIKHVRIWRPLIAESREDLHMIVRSSGLQPINDDTNADTIYRRNQIRHDVLPVLQRFEPTVNERLGNLASIAADESDFLESLAGEILASVGERSGLPLNIVADLHPALGRRVIRRWLLEQGSVITSFERVEAIRDLSSRNRGGAAIEIGEHMRVQLRHGLLELVRDRS
jgi:tRNA(Ile)-lysidine synthetase-like protein